jgi:O-antigen ligase
MNSAATTRRATSRTERFVATGGILTAALVSIGLATDVPLGLALMVGALYAALVVVNFPVAVCLWVPLAFLEGYTAFNLGGKAAGLLLTVGWLGALQTGVATTSVLRRHRRLVEVLGLFVVWLSLSVAWAPDTGRALGDLWHWYAVALIFVIVATCVNTPSTLRLVCGAFVAGAFLSVVASAATGNLRTGAGTERLAAAAGDPNSLAMGLVAGIAVAAALAIGLRSAGWRWLLIVVIAVLAAGIVATESRGGIVAVVATAVAAVAVFKGRRKQVLGVVLVVAAAITVSFAFNPDAWQRVTKPDSRGTGRIDLWTVAWNISADHPFTGIGLRNFGVVAQDYTRKVGPLERVDLIADRPKVVHNTYLQLLAETGIVGLSLFAVLVLGCLRAGLRAAGRFRAIGAYDLEVLAQGVVVAVVGMLAAGFFLSSAIDRRMWILFALGPAALEVAQRTAGRIGGYRVPRPGGAGTRTSARRNNRTAGDTLRRKRRVESML